MMETLIEWGLKGLMWIGISLVAGFFLAIFDLIVWRPYRVKLGLDDNWKKISVVILAVFLTQAFVGSAFALTERHVENLDGSISVTVEMTVQEQAFENASYDMGNGIQGVYLDEFSTNFITKEKFVAQEDARLARIDAFNTGTLKQARGALKGGVISNEEFFEYHKQVNVLNSELNKHRAEVKAEISPIKKSEPRPESHTVKIVKPRVLVAG